LSFPSLASLIFEYIYSIYLDALAFFIEIIFVYIVIRMLGEKLPYKNFLSTMLFLSIFLILNSICSLVFFLFESIVPITTFWYTSIIVITIIFIWKSYCAIIGLSTMQQISRKVATIGVLLPFSFFYTIDILFRFVAIAVNS
jgi:hypothetical protein